jgi:glycogen operon protein
MLADTKIIAEAWDAAGAYQVGTFGASDRWAEWNGRYRDDVRRYWLGDRGMRGAMATRLSGSADLYESNGRPPHCSINFVTSHDGFTLNDLVSYNEKHNLANHEQNRDGDNNNHSYNYGHEGPSDDPLIESLRIQHIKNLLTSLMLSQGVPMLVAGDECRRTQNGNNNAWCQDNETSWFDWRRIEDHAELLRFTRGLIHFRRGQPAVRRRDYLTGRKVPDRLIADVTWFDAAGRTVDWHSPELPISCLLAAPHFSADPSGTGKDIFMLLNPEMTEVEFAIPQIVSRRRWNRFVDTAAAPPADLFPGLDGPPLDAGPLTLKRKSMAVFVSG